MGKPCYLSLQLPSVLGGRLKHYAYSSMGLMGLMYSILTDMLLPHINVGPSKSTTNDLNMI
jgi:hypothetical protein